MATEEVALAYPPGAVERAMKVHEVITRALDGQLSWIQATEILGRSPRSIRRLRWRLQQSGYDGLFDRRRRTPSPKRAPVAEVQRVLALYCDRYQGFNVRHFHQLARRQHGVRFCYAFVKKAPQSAGLVPKHRPRGRHRRRREPRLCFGELLHLDGSRHHWLALMPDQWLPLIAVVDDATKRLLYAQPRGRRERRGHPDRAARRPRDRGSTDGPVHGPRPLGRAHPGGRRRAGSPPSDPGGAGPRPPRHRTHPRLLPGGPRPERARQPHAAGSPRQRAAGGRHHHGPGRQPLPARAVLPAFNAEFARAPADPATAFVPLGRVDLEQILGVEEERVVGRDNVVTAAGLALQVAKQPGRRSCAGLRVLVRRHLNGEHSLWYGARCLGRYDRQGRALRAA